jgi:putative peptidoglycan lipid II flippase
MPQREKITRATGVVGSATLISRILGFVRDMVIAQLFGAHGATDAFFVAFGVPNLLRRVFAEGGLTASFVPVYSEYLDKEGVEDTRKLADATFTTLAVVLAAVSVAGVVLAPWLIKILVPGFAGVSGKIELTVLLTRIVFPFIFFVGLGSLSTGILNTRGHFFWPAVSPAFLNLSMISLALLLYARLGVPVVALAIGALLGGVLQLIIQYPPMITRGVAPRLTRNILHPGLWRVLKLMLPALLGLGVNQINILVDRWIASWLPEGSVSYLYYGNRLVQFPLGVFGIAIAVAILPVLSDHAAKEEMAELKASLLYGLKLAMFVMIPASAGLMALKTPMINVLFQRGAFGPDAATATASALFYYSIGLFAFAGVKVAASGLYSLQDTKSPFIISIYALIINVVFNIVLMGPMRHNGLALATSISSIFNFLALLFIFRRKVGGYGARELLGSASKSLAASAVLALVVWIIYLNLFSQTSPLLIRVGVLTLCIVVGLVIYFIINYIWKSEELGQLFKLLRRA